MKTYPPRRPAFQVVPVTNEVFAAHLTKTVMGNLLADPQIRSAWSTLNRESQQELLGPASRAVEKELRNRTHSVTVNAEVSHPTKED